MMEKYLHYALVFLMGMPLAINASVSLNEDNYAESLGGLFQTIKQPFYDAVKDDLGELEEKIRNSDDSKERYGGKAGNDYYQKYVKSVIHPTLVEFFTIIKEDVNEENVTPVLDFLFDVLGLERQHIGDVVSQKYVQKTCRFCRAEEESCDCGFFGKRFKSLGENGQMGDEILEESFPGWCRKMREIKEYVFDAVESKELWGQRGIELEHSDVGRFYVDAELDHSVNLRSREESLSH
ncbi:MAG: hypothetical protein GY915_00380, partial [bacterium]|nr:hypothetical protein [bacterium]